MRPVLACQFYIEPGVQVIEPWAEVIPLPGASAALPIACTRYHWFDRDGLFAEAARILSPRVVLALVRNRPRPCHLIDALNGYIAGDLLNMSDYARRERTDEPSVRALAAQGRIMSAKSRTYTRTQETDARRPIELLLTRLTGWAIMRHIRLPPGRRLILAMRPQTVVAGPARMWLYAATPEIGTDNLVVTAADLRDARLGWRESRRILSRASDLPRRLRDVAAGHS